MGHRWAFFRSVLQSIQSCVTPLIFEERYLLVFLRGGAPLANHKSAEKRARQSLKRQAVNRKTIATVRTAEIKLRKALTGKDVKGAQAALVEFSSRVSKAAQKGRMPFERASRKVSRLSKQVQALVK